MDDECEFCDEDATSSCKRCDAKLCGTHCNRKNRKPYCGHCVTIVPERESADDYE
jgi:hypothetical protein